MGEGEACPMKMIQMQEDSIVVRTMKLVNGTIPSVSTTKHMTHVLHVSVSTISGKVIMHCHDLMHEDGGMMGWVDVQGGPDDDTTGIVVESIDCMNVLYAFLLGDFSLHGHLMIAIICEGKFDNIVQ